VGERRSEAEGRRRRKKVLDSGTGKRGETARDIPDQGRVGPGKLGRPNDDFFTEMKM
jgi:hypothetical protein